MTDHPTTPPPGPLPSVLPDDNAHSHAEAFALGSALNGLSEIDRYLRGRCDAELSDAVNKLAADERKERDEFRQEMRLFARRMELKIDTVINTMRPFGQRLTALERNCNSNHEHTPLASVPPSTRDLDVEDEAQEA
jgi:hypothetical protein